MNSCPVISGFVRSVIARNPPSALNKDIIQGLNSVLHRTQHEVVGPRVVVARGLRAFELAFVSVFSLDLRNLEEPPSPRADAHTLDELKEKLRIRLEDAIVENVEVALGVEVNRRSPLMMKRTENIRVHKGGQILMFWMEPIKQMLRGDDLLVYGRIGEMLAEVCTEMVIGLSKQLAFGEVLLNTREL